MAICPNCGEDPCGAYWRCLPVRLVGDALQDRPVFPVISARARLIARLLNDAQKGERHFMTMWEALLDLYTADEAREFLCSPQATLDDEVPAVMIAKGRVRAVRDVIDRCREGVHG